MLERTQAGMEKKMDLFRVRTHKKIELDSMVLSFIWNYKSHRIRKGHLCKNKTEGGLALPDYEI